MDFEEEIQEQPGESVCLFNSLKTFHGFPHCARSTLFGLEMCDIAIGTRLAKEACWDIGRKDL